MHALQSLQAGLYAVLCERLKPALVSVKFNLLELLPDISVIIFFSFLFGRYGQIWGEVP